MAGMEVIFMIGMSCLLILSSHAAARTTRTNRNYESGEDDYTHYEEWRDTFNVAESTVPSEIIVEPESLDNSPIQTTTAPEGPEEQVTLHYTSSPIDEDLYYHTTTAKPQTKTTTPTSSTFTSTTTSPSPTPATTTTTTTERILSETELESMAILNESRQKFKFDTSELQLYKQKIKLTRKVLKSPTSRFLSTQLNMTELLSTQLRSKPYGDKKDASKKSSFSAYKQIRDNTLENEVLIVERTLLATDRQLVQRYSVPFNDVGRHLESFRYTLGNILLPRLLTSVQTSTFKLTQAETPTKMTTYAPTQAPTKKLIIIILIIIIIIIAFFLMLE